MRSCTLTGRLRIVVIGRRAADYETIFRLPDKTEAVFVRLALAAERKDVAIGDVPVEDQVCCARSNGLNIFLSQDAVFQVSPSFKAGFIPTDDIAIRKLERFSVVWNLRNYSFDYSKPNRIFDHKSWCSPEIFKIINYVRALFRIVQQTKKIVASKGAQSNVWPFSVHQRIEAFVCDLGLAFDGRPLPPSEPCIKAADEEQQVIGDDRRLIPIVFMGAVLLCGSLSSWARIVCSASVNAALSSIKALTGTVGSCWYA